MKAAAQQPGYFDALYAADPDPWGFETSPYEQEKYAATIAALPRLRYRSALEVGCSIGVLTDQLADRSERLLGIDISDAALSRAARRCSHRTNVAFARSTLPHLAPTGPFDLIVLSEVLYYFDTDELAALARSLSGQLVHDATLLLVHWLGPTPDYPMSGEEATACFEQAMPGWQGVIRHRTADYRLDLLCPGYAG